MSSPVRHTTRSTRRWLCLCWAIVCAALLPLAWSGRALADDDPPPTRKAALQWDASRRELRVTFGYRDVVDSAIRKKLVRGLPTTIVMTGTLLDARSKEPLSTTTQTCKITWHVWNEAYRLEITRPEGSRTRWTPTLEGVLRRCSEARALLVATTEQVSEGREVLLQASVVVNPVSPSVLTKIKHWVSRPLRTGTAAPGDALFSTFTGLFMRRLGEAERRLEILTKPVVPDVAPARGGRERGTGDG